MVLQRDVNVVDLDFGTLRDRVKAAFTSRSHLHHDVEGASHLYLAPRQRAIQRAHFAFDQSRYRASNGLFSALGWRPKLPMTQWQR